MKEVLHPREMIPESTNQRVPNPELYTNPNVETRFEGLYLSCSLNPDTLKINFMEDFLLITYSVSSLNLKNVQDGTVSIKLRRFSLC